MKKIAIIFISIIIIFSTGCAHQPINTLSLIESQKAIAQSNRLSFHVRDERDAQFKEEKVFTYDFQYPVAIYSFGDAMFDIPMSTVFEKMLYARFGNNSQGYKTEAVLKGFYTTAKPNPMTGIPFIGLLVIGADAEWHGILNLDIAVLDNNEKYIFQKTYNIDIKEMREPSPDIA